MDVRAKSERDVGMPQPGGDQSNGYALKVHERRASVSGVVEAYLRHGEVLDRCLP